MFVIHRHLRTILKEQVYQTAAAHERRPLPPLRSAAAAATATSASFLKTIHHPPFTRS
jgi:hypothetical protein